jgi:mRNA-degrading endonuclease RelE of RelBE toxin-antitoxin system
MEFRLEFQPEAERALLELEKTDPKKYKKIRPCMLREWQTE